ncbi:MULTISPECIES: class I SAM-dependent methyltransferase [Thermomonosporaceae]|uniref:class I SAM-dependent methyltransferase n=1 Tax=Thermomonosporaceae TaxID=2012 RepID=UPI00255AF3EC|nr:MULTISPECIES: class I SAM-dependent methyltransferase [Thermomonosporaceae]MDL4774151.1 class I SAM-dependent methyltransferase [Actinomadura xylanilytica]
MNAVTRQARVDFALALRQQWARSLYPTLVGQAGPDPDRAAVHAAPVYPWFAWLERSAQKMLWRAVAGAVDAEDLPASAPGLELDPGLELPAWYTGVDIHLQPGGVWSTDHAALVYEAGAKLVMLGDNDDFAFHTLFTDTAVPDRPYRRIVDLGCGFGKSTRPFKRRWPDAEVIGVDLSAPVLRLAAHRTAETGIRYVQADAAATGLPAGSADLVTATMLVHELPPPVLADLLADAARVLAPGGLLRILDFHPTGDPVRDLALVEHGDRNNEPYLPMLFGTDVLARCAEAGLADARWVAFDERGAGRLETTRWPDRAEWHFPWAVLEARKPEDAHV